MSSDDDVIIKDLVELSKTIISYETGDVMILSEIIDSLALLEAKILPKTPQFYVCECLTTLAKDELKEDGKDFLQLLSQGIDFLRDLEETEGDFPPWKLQKIDTWRQKITDKASLPQTKGTLMSIVSTPNKNEQQILLDKDQINLFISDCEERLARAQEIILFLEEDLENPEYIKELFRIFHTIKGESGFLKLATLGTLTHNVENLLDLLRSKQLIANAESIDRLLQGVDLAVSLLKALKTGAVVVHSKVSIDEYIDTLTHFTGSVKPSLGSIMVAQGTITERDLSDIIHEQVNTGFEKKFGQVAIDKKIITQEELTQTLERQIEHRDCEQTSEVGDLKNKFEDISQANREKELNDPLIKVKTSKVNYLVDMIGELLIALGQVEENLPTLMPVRKISRTLQYAGMQLRTESVHVLFGSMKRIIRDTAAKVGKPVRMEFNGSELEIDRTLIESLEEPLMHLVRNSLDHGIEDAESRISAGKPAEGLVRLSAERRGNNIVISVFDDGGGLNRENILRKAIEKRIIKEEDAEAMSDSAVFNLIFVSGFSTKKQVDYVSGRGVGMDIVKAAIMKAKGHIEIESHPGLGTTFLLFTPLSTAIIDGMTIRVGKNIFILPISVIIESLKLKPGMTRELIKGVEVLQLRGETIPIIHLSKVFGIENAGSGAVVTIVENNLKEHFAIASDEIIAKREVVIKSLGARFRDLKGISSGTVLAGGAIGLVLDLEELINLSTEDVQETFIATGNLS